MTGLLENDVLRSLVLSALARRRGVAAPAGAVTVDRYAHLAAWLRSAIDVPELLTTIAVPGA